MAALRLHARDASEDRVLRICVLPWILLVRHPTALLPWLLLLALPPVARVWFPHTGPPLFGTALIGALATLPMGGLLYQAACLLDGRQAPLREVLRALARRWASLPALGSAVAVLAAAPAWAESALVSLPLRLLFALLLLRMAFLPQVLLLEPGPAAEAPSHAWRAGRGHLPRLGLLAAMCALAYVLAARGLSAWPHPLAGPVIVVAAAVTQGVFLLGATAIFRAAIPGHRDASRPVDAAPPPLPEVVPSPPSTPAQPAPLEDFGGLPEDPPCR